MMISLLTIVLSLYCIIFQFDSVFNRSIEQYSEETLSSSKTNALPDQHTQYSRSKRHVCRSCGFVDNRPFLNNHLMNNHINTHGPHRFPFTDGGYSKTAFNVYFLDKKVQGASPSTFKPLKDGYAKDAWAVFYMGERVKGASSMSFEYLGDGYAKDPWKVFYLGEEVIGAHSMNFKPVGHGYGKDMMNMYFRGKVLH